MRGGKRKGSGRKKGEGSKVVRVPIGCLDLVYAVISKHKGDDENHIQYLSDHLRKTKQKDTSQKREDTKALKPYLDEFKRLPRNHRKMLLKKYKTAEGVARHLMKTPASEIT